MFIVASSGCVSTNEPGAVRGGTIQESLKDIAESYQLIAVNSAAIPATISHDNATIKVHSGDFIIRADGTCSTTSVFSRLSGGKVTRKVHGSFTRKGSKLEIQWQGAGATTGTIDGETFSMNNHGIIFMYSRSGEVGDSVKLDLAQECNEGTKETGIEKAQAGVFDDFNTRLKTGWDRNQIPIGFIPFQDSGPSLVNISTTSEHPRLPDEGSGNKVLQLDLNVKAWAGVIHNFENEAVNRWTPRDWRGFSEFSFWLYGNNTNTSLFIEIADNRKPCPTQAGAEVYTFPFTDNFSGWKKITVPFANLIRNEIYNNAPDDGLGLSEVHGWAFGTLKTGGPVTYYLDDFELQ
jgi:hypothetical protein